MNNNDFANFADFATFGAQDLGDHGGGQEEENMPPTGPPTVNTAHERERAALRIRARSFLPQVHIPRPELNAQQRNLGPPGGEFCMARFCSAQCVAASCAGFIRSESAGTADVDITNVRELTRQLRKIAIRNHPDRHPEARVGVEAAARATVRTQQTTLLLAMLEDHEYVSLRVHVEGATAGGADNGENEIQVVVLNRVHLDLTVQGLRDVIVEERPELLANRERLGMSVIGAPGRAETRLHVVGNAQTLRDLRVTRESALRVWVTPEGETASEWEAFSN